jgi:FkbM family methyltransferase
MDTRSALIDARRRTAAAVAALQGRDGHLDPAPGTVAWAVQRDIADLENMRRLLAFTLVPNANCIDVGASRGAILSEMLRVAPAGHHIAFEPLPHLAEDLRSTFPQVTVHQSALFDVAGSADFTHVRGASDGLSGLRSRPPPPGELATSEVIEVQVRVLDEILDPDYVPSLIKIDVEGAELHVMQGAIQTLRQYRPIVIFEHGSGAAELYGTAPSDVYGLLADDIGLRIFDLDGRGPYGSAQFERTFHTGELVNFVARV